MLSEKEKEYLGKWWAKGFADIERIRGDYLCDPHKRMRMREKWWAEERRYYDATPTKNKFLRFFLLSVCPCCCGLAINFAKIQRHEFKRDSSLDTFLFGYYRKYECKRCGIVEIKIHWDFRPGPIAPMTQFDFDEDVLKYDFHGLYFPHPCWRYAQLGKYVWKEVNQNGTVKHILYSEFWRGIRKKAIYLKTSRDVILKTKRRDYPVDFSRLIFGSKLFFKYESTAEPFEKDFRENTLKMSWKKIYFETSKKTTLFTRIYARFNKGKGSLYC